MTDLDESQLSDKVMQAPRNAANVQGGPAVQEAKRTAQ